MSAWAGNERCPFANLILSGDARSSRDGYASGNLECLPVIFLASVVGKKNVLAGC